MMHWDIGPPCRRETWVTSSGHETWVPSSWHETWVPSSGHDTWVPSSGHETWVPTLDLGTPSGYETWVPSSWHETWVPSSGHETWVTSLAPPSGNETWVTPLVTSSGHHYRSVQSCSLHLTVQAPWERYLVAIKGIMVRVSMMSYWEVPQGIPSKFRINCLLTLYYK